MPQVRNVATKSGLALDEQQLDDVDLQPVAKRLKSTADDNVPSSLTQSIIEMAAADNKQNGGSFDSNVIFSCFGIKMRDYGKNNYYNDLSDFRSFFLY